MFFILYMSIQPGHFMAHLNLITFPLKSLSERKERIKTHNKDKRAQKKVKSYVGKLLGIVQELASTR